MRTERVGLIGVAIALLVGALLALLSGTGPGGAPATAASTVSYPPLLKWVLWGTLGLFAAVAVAWVVLTYVVGAGYEPPPIEYGPETVQVRILTVDAESVVQRTVDSLPDALADVHVVAEEPLDVAGATVHAVPDAFECTAVRKGRAIEWARRELETDREFVLYLDEDSLVESFEGLPDADVVQLQERPRRTGSVLSHLADVYRMGVQLEQRAFARLSIPLFAWGGGIAVRSELEDAVTWDRETLVEDTAFVWAAFEEHDADFALASAVCRNEAPPSLYEIAQQRRRWAAGNLQAASMLPARYRLLTRIRNCAWALSPIVTLVAVPLSLLGVVVYGGLFVLLSALLAAFTVFWYLRGVFVYGRERLTLALATPLAPLVTVVHSMGTVAGILAPPDGFRVTTKTGGD
ncbi:glycosyltransferase family 2 protein [Halosegnis sp.]|uniref:glycosyltransferase family 2 protein n=1 Tax=Halosegnis sp. TaxID=2864959 RepID=UPI0035D4916C